MLLTTLHKNHLGPSLHAVNHGKADESQVVRATIVVQRKIGHSELPSIKQGQLTVRPSEEEFAAKWGASQEDIDAIKTHYMNEGLHVVETHLARRQVVLEGQLKDFNAAFKVNTHNFEKKHLGKTVRFRHHFEPIQVPANLAPRIVQVLNLANEPMGHPHFQTKAEATPEAIGVLPGAATLVPSQVLSAYNWPSITTTGQVIGIFVGGLHYLGANLGYNPSDVTATCNTFGVATPNIVNIAVDGSTGNVGTSNPQSIEVILDIGMAAACAKGATLAMYFAGNSSLEDAIARMVHRNPGDPVVTVISISYGTSVEAQSFAGEFTALDTYLNDAVTAGITVCVSSGDRGSDNGGLALGLAPWAGQANVSVPANHPLVIAIGGTTLVPSPLKEWLWCENQGGNVPNEGAGGGVSAGYAPQPFQSNIGVPRNINNNVAGRALPDVSGNASPDSGYPLTFQGQQQVVGGTSATAPMYAGLIAMMNVQLHTKLGTTGNLGWISPTLYAAGSSVVRDINPANTVGGPQSNSTNGVPGYPLLTGYDCCVGWGVLNPTAFTNLFQPTITGITLSNSTISSTVVTGTTIGTISVQTSGGAFSGTLSVGGTDASHFQITGTSLRTLGTLTARNYSITISALATGASGPFTSPFTITAFAPVTITGISLSSVSGLQVAANSQIATIQVITSPAGSFTGTLSLGPGAPTSFSISGTSLRTTVANIPLGAYSIPLVATQAQATGSPFSQNVTYTFQSTSSIIGITLSGTSVAVGAPNGTVVGVISVQLSS